MPPSPPQADPHPAASLTGISKLYGSFAALRNVTLTLPAGQCIMVLGENGAGKSTLLRTLAGLIRPTLGTLTVLGGDPDDVRSRIGYMSHASMLYDELSALENLRYFHSLYSADSPLDPAAPALALTAVGLDPALTRPVANYSQGMRQRASMARAMLTQPDLLLLDEPFSNLDAGGAAQMVTHLAAFRVASPHRTVILTTHQPQLAESIADTIVTMHAGQILSVISRVAKSSEAEARA